MAGNDRIRIGITERGDAGLDLGWTAKLPGSFNCAILITKQITPRFHEEVLRLHENGFPLIVQANCTGLGSTPVEPNVPMPSVQLTALRRLVDAGFPLERVVLRIDPIAPAPYGIQAFENVLALARAGFPEGLPRVRVSIMDAYPHVQERFRKAGLAPVGEGSFHAGQDWFDAVSAVMTANPDLAFESCAEPRLSAPNLERVGCASAKDLAILGLPVPGCAALNPQGRSGCLCLQGKADLLDRKHPCHHGCLYCYWKDAK